MHFIMYVILFVYGIACFILTAVILLQSGKGGGLSSLGAANQGLSDALGSSGAERTLTRWTTYAAVTFLLLALVISVISPWAVNRGTNILNRPAAAAPPAAAGTIPGGAPAGGAAGIPGATGQTAPNTKRPVSVPPGVVQVPKGALPAGGAAPAEKQ